jgi:lipopolysaccharide/colanic/teichoic acid biosynthesis glycosyltransferase
VKRLLDLTLAVTGLLLVAPFLSPLLILVWRQDRRSPLYVATRVGQFGCPFHMVKLRSMVPDADATGVDSTSADDARVTPLGRFIRRYKLDELPQLWNVIRGDMSLVGPRPNVQRETSLYTSVERRLLDVRPGITDFASIVFSDLGDVLKGHSDPDLAYNQLVRPGKSALGLFYVDHHSTLVDIQLCWLTIVSAFSPTRARAGVVRLLKRLGACDDLLEVAGRTRPLIPTAPPGSQQVVACRSPLR